MADRVELAIDGMHCDHCEVTVGAALERAGLQNVDVDWRRGEASGERTEAYGLEQAESEVAGIGYRVVGEVDQDSQTGATVPEDEVEYDLLILGSGSAAFAAAIKARDLGATVAMVERSTIGGTCVNVGCVPSKALLRAAEAYWNAGHSPFAGVPTATAGDVDLRALVDQKRGLVQQLRREKYEDLVDAYEFDVIEGDARFIDSESVSIGDRQLRAGRILIATGADAWVPPIPGLEDTGYITSTEAVELSEVPGELTVVGADAIGLELGQLFLHLGSQVTFVEALDRIAPFEEPEISETLREYLESQGARVITGATVAAAGRNGDSVWVDVDAGSESMRVEGTHLLMATGRRASTEGLGLDVAGVDVDERGRVVVDDTLATSNPLVFAAGDVTAHPQFVYVAALGGNIAAENALRGTTRRIDFRTMPRVTFTSPTIASVGLTEAEAEAAGHPVITSVLPLEAAPRALVDHATEGLIKLIADEASGHILGVHILADGAADVIQAAVMAMKYRATIDEVAETYHPYLTMAEGLKLAAQAFGKDIKLLSCCAA